MRGELLRRARASMFRPKDWLDRVFEIGIIAKGLNGVAELIGGLLLLFVSPTRLQHLAGALTQGELSEDPHDFIATHLLHTVFDLLIVALTWREYARQRAARVVASGTAGPAAVVHVVGSERA